MKKEPKKLISYINSLSMRKDIKERILILIEEELSNVSDIKKPDDSTKTVNPSPKPPPPPPPNG